MKHFADHDYSVEELSADPKQAFTYRQYERTNDADIKYRLPVSRQICVHVLDREFRAITWTKDAWPLRSSSARK